VKRKGKWVSALVVGVTPATNLAPPFIDIKVSGSGTELQVKWELTHVKRVAPVITKGKRPGGGR